VLWESYRSVSDWATTPRGGRVHAMFGARAAERRAGQLSGAGVVDDAARAALETLRGVVDDPGRARARAVALACRRLSAWAGERGRPATQFYFAAAAGLCVPDDARHAYLAGRLARDLAKWDTAEAWLEFAVAAAKRKRDRETQTVAMLGLGNTFYRQGFYRKARETHLAALALARRHDLREYCGRALHDLFVVSLDLRDTRAAEAYAREAVEAYGAAHPNVPALAHDVAYFWLGQGFSTRALPVLRAVLPHLRNPDQRIRVLASAARAAAGSGEHAVFVQLVGEVRQAGLDPLARSALAAALFEAAVGASLLRDQGLAGELLDEVVHLARERGEEDVLARAEELRGGIPAGAEAATHAPAVEQDDDDLARELVNSLLPGGNR
jgi:tetratricopeptide (TPR) repeat protein